jgi:hypothetical protein
LNAYNYYFIKQKYLENPYGKFYAYGVNVITISDCTVIREEVTATQRHWTAVIDIFDNLNFTLSEALTRVT